MLCTPRLEFSSVMNRRNKDLPITGTSVPLKMKRKTLKHLSQEERLEIENKKMEERLQSLRREMLVEKEARESTGGVHWSSGKTGPLVSHATNVLKKNRKLESKKIPLKIKVLTDSNIEVPSPSRHDLTKKGKNALKTSERPKEAVVGNQSQPKSSAAIATSESTDSSSTGGLLWGTYDEEASAKSFQEALQAWRCTSKKTIDNMAEATTTTTPEKTSREVQAGRSKGGPVGVMGQLKSCDGFLNERSSSLNYMEQMLLRRMRSNTPPVLRAAGAVSQCDMSVDGLDVEATDDGQMTGGYVCDIDSVDEVALFSHAIGHRGVEEELVITEVSDSELVELDGARPSSEAIIDEGSNDSSGVDQEEAIPVEQPVTTSENELSAHSCELKDEITSENHREARGEKSSNQSSRKFLTSRRVSRQTKSRGKKQDRVEEVGKVEAADEMQLTGITGSVPMTWTHSRPYSGLGGFFLAAVDSDNLEAQENSTDTTVENTNSSVLFTAGTMWYPHASQVDASSESSLVDNTDHLNPEITNVQNNSDSEDEDDESLPVYLRPSSVLQDVGVDERNRWEDDEDTKTLEDLAVELQSLSRLEEQDQHTVGISTSDSEQTHEMSDDSVSVNSPGQTMRHLDIDTLMDDFEEIESKIMQGHECQ